MSAPLLSVSGLGVTIDGSGGAREILRDVALDIEPGRAVGLVGESGSGKSMTALAVMGLLPDRARPSGSIRFDGTELAGLDDATLSTYRGRRMAMVFQEPMTALNPVHTIGAQIAEGVVRHLGISRAAARDRARELLDRVGLPASSIAAGLRKFTLCRFVRMATWQVRQLFPNTAPCSSQLPGTPMTG